MGWRGVMESRQIQCAFDVSDISSHFFSFQNTFTNPANVQGTGLYESVGGDVRKLVIEGHRCSWCRTANGQVLYRIASTNSESDGRDL